MVPARETPVLLRHSYARTSGQLQQKRDAMLSKLEAIQEFLKVQAEEAIKLNGDYYLDTQAFRLIVEHVDTAWRSLEYAKSQLQD